MTVSRQIGQFRVAGRFFQNLEAGDGANLFRDMIVLRAEPEWPRNGIRYVGIHPEFAPVALGEEPPEYTALFDLGSVYPKWVRVHD